MPRSVLIRTSRPMCSTPLPISASTSTLRVPHSSCSVFLARRWYPVTEGFSFGVLAYAARKTRSSITACSTGRGTMDVRSIQSHQSRNAGWIVANRGKRSSHRFAIWRGSSLRGPQAAVTVSLASALKPGQGSVAASRRHVSNDDSMTLSYIVAHRISGELAPEVPFDATTCSRDSRSLLVCDNLELRQ